MLRFLTLVLSVWLVVALHPAKGLTYTEDFSSGLGNWEVDIPNSTAGYGFFYDGPGERAQANHFGPPFDVFVHNVSDTFDITGPGDVLTFDIDVDFTVAAADHTLEFYLLDSTELIGAGFDYDLGTGNFTQLMGGSATADFAALPTGTSHTMRIDLTFDGVNIAPTFTFGGNSLVGDPTAFSAPETLHAMFTFKGVTNVQNLFFDNVSITLVPEPSAAILFVGAAGLLFGARRR